MKTVIVLLIIAICLDSGLAWHCSKCRRDDCKNVRRRSCIYGITYDRCDCCTVCAKGPDDRCYTNDDCGYAMSCKKRRSRRWGTCVQKYKECKKQCYKWD